MRDLKRMDVHAPAGIGYSQHNGMPPRADVLRDGESRTGAVNINPRIVSTP